MKKAANKIKSKNVCDSEIHIQVFKTLLVTSINE